MITTETRSQPLSQQKTRSWDAQSIRADFPILHQKVHGHPLIYFDNAATTQKPRMVLDKMRHYYEWDNSNVHRGIHELSNRATAAYEGARARAARFLKARSPEEIIFTRGTTEGVNLVAYAWGLRHIKAGDTILLTEVEHHSNLVPWQLLAKRVGANLRYVPITGEEALLDASLLDQMLTSRVKLFAMTHISNSLGVINPVADFCARARRHGITTLVDAAQSAGHRPLDVQEIGCDFLAFSGHKMCGPTGIGVLYGRHEVLADMDPFHGGGEMILSVDYQETTFKSAPHVFEAGTPNMAGAIGLHAAMDYLDELGRDAISAHDQEIGAYAAEQLRTLKGIRILGPKSGRAGLVSFAFPEVHAHDLVTFADQRGVALRGGHHCNQPLMRKLQLDSSARASFYIYNDLAEVDRFMGVMREILKFFGAGQ